MTDRIGLGWRSELACTILTNLDRIDLVEVMAEGWTEAPSRARRALRTLAAQVPVTIHAVSLGMASAAPVDRQRLSALARLVGEVRPAGWSEHIAFVRAGGVEIGHLAAPPRCGATVDGLARNVRTAASTVGAMPLLENPASLIDPPGSDRGEARFLCDALEATGARLLLDLHNLWTNALNFGFDATAAIAALPADRIAAVHIAGGRFVRLHGARRRLDDHLHEVPGEVFALLEEVAARAAGPLDVILERDGNYPAAPLLLAELDRARAAVRAGRRRAGDPPVALPVLSERPGSGGAGGTSVEAFLARLYLDAALRAEALGDPRYAALRAGLTPAQSDCFASVDKVGLEMAARSFAHKRAASPARGSAARRRVGVGACLPR